MNRQEATQLWYDIYNEIQAWPILPRGTELIGSAMYADDPQDVDVMILVYDRVVYVEQCHAKGFVGQKNPDYPGEWVSLKRDNINLLVTDDEEYWIRSRDAAWVCEGLKLKTRKERVIVHRIIVDCYSPQGAIDSVADWE